MNTAEAIKQAELMLSNAETVYDRHVSRRIVAGLLAAIESSPCYAKAMRLGLETFVLIESDLIAPLAIGTWVEDSHGIHNPDKRADALAIARRWRDRQAGKS